jgi:hypothetical protein
MSERKGCWGCLGGVLTVLGVGFAIFKWGTLPLVFIQPWMEAKEEEKRQKVDTAAKAARIAESFLKRDEEDGTRLISLDGKVVPLYYPTIAEVKKGMAAEEARMEVGDQILRVNGVSVLDGSKDTDLLGKALDSCRNKKVPIIVMREGKRVTLTVSVSPEGTIGIRIDMQKKR